MFTTVKLAIPWMILQLELSLSLGMDERMTLAKRLPKMEILKTVPLTVPMTLKDKSVNLPRIRLTPILKILC